MLDVWWYRTRSSLCSSCLSSLSSRMSEFPLFTSPSHCYPLLPFSFFTSLLPLASHRHRLQFVFNFFILSSAFFSIITFIVIPSQSCRHLFMSFSHPSSPLTSSLSRIIPALIRNRRFRAPPVLSCSTTYHLLTYLPSGFIRIAGPAPLCCRYIALLYFVPL